jgi:two-component system, cell cycle sensor histidine kinase and response regulator CckA
MALNEIRHRARLTKEYGATPLVDADDVRLGQVFINLLVNAAQALPEGRADSNEVRVITSTDAMGRAVVEIHDTGSGIPESVLGRVFDPFFTTKPIGLGTGLGLSICHNIVTSMGGTITVESEIGRGTRFRVVLPASVQCVPEEHRPSAPAPVASQSRASVLVVDDERAVGDMIGRVLRHHDVTIVTSAKEALALVFSNRPYDVIVSDLMMPEVSGMELYDELAMRRPNDAERMIFVTGGAFTPAASAFLDRVTNERIEKPFDPGRFRALVQAAIDGSPNELGP